MDRLPPEVLASCATFVSDSDRLLDSRLSILADVNLLQYEEFGIDNNRMGAVGTCF